MEFIEKLIGFHSLLSLLLFLSPQIHYLLSRLGKHLPLQRELLLKILTT